MSEPANEIRLSVLEQGQLRDGLSAGDVLHSLIDTAAYAEQLGYARYWIAEHHAKYFAQSCPEVLIPLAAAATSSIRVGAAGILLRYYSPIKIAECFLALEALFPGRIDLGICRGPGVEAKAVAHALVYDNLAELADGSFYRKAVELSEILRQSGRDECASPPGPNGVAPPPLWILGGRRGSMELAVQLQRPLGLMCFSPASITPTAELLREYRGRVSSEAARDAIVAITVCCASGGAEAFQFAQTEGKSPTIVGSPAECASQLLDLHNTLGVSEFVIMPFARSIRDLHFALESLANCVCSTVS